MSLDISRMVAHLPRERKVAVLRAYRRQSKHDTTAFLYCFFLGTLGVHRMYLGQWRAALPRLLMGAVFLGIIVVGVVFSLPLAVVIGVPAALAVIALGWEILDLFQIDAQVEAYNRAVLERLLAAEAPAAPAEPVPARTSAGIITAADVASAQALAGEVGAGRAASYDGAAATPPHGPETSAWTTPAAATPPVSSGTNYAAPGWQDGDQRTWEAAPTPWAETPAVPLAMAGAPLADDVTDRHPRVEPVEPIADVEDGTPIYVALSASAQSAGAPPLQPLLRDLSDDHPGEREPAPVADVEGAGSRPVVVPLAAGMAASAAAMFAGAAATPPALAPTGRDVSDAHPQPGEVPPVADVEPGQGQAVYVTVPQPHLPAAGAFAGGVAAMPAAAPTSDGGGEALVLLVPQEDALAGDHAQGSPPAQAMPRGPEPASVPVLTDQYVPPTAPPIWPVAPQDEPPAAPIWPGAPAPEDDTQTLAELAAFGGAAAAGLAAERVEQAGSASAPPAQPATPAGVPAEPTRPLPYAASAEPTRPLPESLSPTGGGSVSGAAAAQPPATQQPMKRVRVVRRIVLEDGGVVRELVAERIVPMNADSQAIAAELEAQLAHASPEEIAQLAHLPAGTDVVVRSRVESGPLSGPLGKPEEPPAQGS